MRKNCGFTLIELSIVIVIIALIIGGVLVGRDLIKAAQLRALVSNEQAYKTAAYTFKSKFGFLPGDMPQTEAQRFGFSYCTTANSCANGDSIINNRSSGVFGNYYADFSYGEPILFWHHLAEAGLLKSSVDVATALDTTLAAWFGVVTTDAPKYLPQQNFKGSFFMVNNPSGLFKNFGLNLVSIFDSGGVGLPNEVLTPLEAFYIDSKSDDGAPSTGRTVAVCGNGAPGSQVGSICPAAQLRCTINTGGVDVYNTNGAAGNTIFCTQRFIWGY